MERKLRPNEEFVKVCEELRRAAPVQWVAFLNCLSHRATEAHQHLLNADRDGVFVAQGRAQEANDLLLTLSAAREVYEKMQQRARD